MPLALRAYPHSVFAIESVIGIRLPIAVYYGKKMDNPAGSKGLRRIDVAITSHFRAIEKES